MPLFKCPEGKSDGSYAVSSYRDVNPVLGTIDDLRDVIAGLARSSISAVVDFIFNHTSNEHEWAKGCASGNPLFDNFYYIFPRPLDARPIRPYPARNLPRSASGRILATGRRTLGMDDVQFLSNGI